MSNLAKATTKSKVVPPLRIITSRTKDVDVPSLNKTLIIPITALTATSITLIAALTGHLPGPPIDSTASFFGALSAGSFDDYRPTLIYRDLAVTVFSAIAALLFVKSCTYLVAVGKMKPQVSRKIIHTFSGPLFILVWPLFSNAYGARVFASIVPLMNAVRLFLAANTSGKNTPADGSEKELIRCISRSGNAQEALGGPFVYVMVLLFFTFFCFTDSPVGIISIATMAMGDGLADLIGRKYGTSNKWPFNKDKSVAGSTAFVVGALLGSFALISWLTSFGVTSPLEFSALRLMGRLLLISVLCAGVELIPGGDDNWTVPISAAVLSSYLLTT